jgi:uncharacterized membrane protein required for colicin V production
MNAVNQFFKSIGGTFGNLPINWVDFVTVLVICVGFMRGRKRGLSEEILDVTKWLVIVVVAGLFYQRLGELMSKRPLLSPLSYYILSYLLLVSVVWLVFGFLKKRFGEKIIESDIFGRFEFYGGMCAGSVRWVCVYFVVLSLLHAPHYTPEERAKRKREVEYNYGSDFFPSIVKFQDAVFTASLTGKTAADQLDLFLMDQVSGAAKPLRDSNSMAKRRERAVDDVISGK